MSFRLEALSRLSAGYLVAVIPGTALAQSQSAPAPAAPAPAAPAPTASAPPGAPPSGGNPVVATVNGEPIHLSDLNAAAQTLPPQVRGMPAQVLYPMLLNQLIDQRALVIEADRTGLAKEPAVQEQVALAKNTALQRAMLMKEVGPQITEQAVHARYERDIAGKSGVEEVNAKQILVPTEAEAKDIITQLDKGADFDALVKKYSKDPGPGGTGDLGFFKKDEMVPAFADAAFALQPGQITQTPVHTQFGWHVIKVVARRTAKPPSFEQAKDELRQKMVQEAIQKAVAHARADVTVQQFNPNGSPASATESSGATTGQVMA